MRRIYLACVLVTLIAALTVYGVSAESPSVESTETTLAEWRDRVNTFLANRLPLVTDRQNAYFSAHGRYWQGLRTNIADLHYTDTVDAAAPGDNLNSAPTDQIETWLAVLPELDGVSLPAVLWIDTYSGPQGHGWVATVLICHNSICYTRSHNVGPETWRTAAWQAVEVIEVQP